MPRELRASHMRIYTAPRGCARAGLAIRQNASSWEVPHMRRQPGVICGGSGLVAFAEVVSAASS